MNVHINPFFRLIRFDKLLLSLLESPFVFQVHRIFQMHLWELILHRSPGQFKRVHERTRLHRIVNRLLHEPKLTQKLSPSLSSQAHRPRIRNLLASISSPVHSRNTDRIIPQLIRTVHLHHALPILRLQVVFLRLLEISVRLQLLSQVQMCLCQQILPESAHKSDHLIVHAILLVHINRQVVLLHRQIHLLSLFKLPGSLQLPRALRIQNCRLLVRHVSNRHTVRVFPLVHATVHLHCISRHPSSHVMPLRLLIRTGLLIMPRNPLKERSSRHRILRLHNRCRLLPLPALYRSLNRFNALPSLHKVVDRSVQLLLMYQPITPLLLQLHDLRWELPTTQIHRSSVSIPTSVSISRLLIPRKPLKVFTSTDMHRRLCQARCNRIQQTGIERVRSHASHNLGCTAWEATLQVQRNRAHKVALLLLHSTGLLLLARLNQPLVMRPPQVLRLGDVLQIRNVDSLLPLVHLCIHIDRILNLPVLEENALC
mmetsp:Transcript_11141/g.13164  ORF Transcript_11141/g.13164 Transcript_11141/m.13164 type:complete len:484 (-) Transcript_11141:2283-3734(-)